MEWNGRKFGGYLKLGVLKHACFLHSLGTQGTWSKRSFPLDLRTSTVLFVHGTCTSTTVRIKLATAFASFYFFINVFHQLLAFRDDMQGLLIKFAFILLDGIFLQCLNQ